MVGAAAQKDPPRCRSAACPPLAAGQTWVSQEAALAAAVQQELLQESLEEAGLVFCQICQKDLSAMNSVRRQQHVNRCLDDMERHLHLPPAGDPVIPECPICGKRFSTLKSRGSHLKRCAAIMEVSPTLLLQAVQQQRRALGNGLPEAQRELKRKAASSAEHLAKKQKMAAKTDGVNADLLVAMTMSRSLLKEEEEKAKCLTGRRQNSRKPPRAEKKSHAKPGLPLLPPLLLQGSTDAHQRMEERVAWLLSEEGEFPSTPPLPTSHLVSAEQVIGLLAPWIKGRCGALWESSSLTGECAPGSFRAVGVTLPPMPEMPAERPALGTFLPSTGPSRPAKGEQKFSDAALLPANICGDPQEKSPGDQRETLACHPDDAETFQDLMELAGEGLTLTQWNLDAVQQLEGPGQDQIPGDVRPPEKQLPPRSCTQTVLLGSLAGAFREMVNNPHLSDIQFQVDSGEVLYAHMFVLYARCPQLMELVVGKGFLVAEEGAAGTRRVLLGDASAEAVGAFLTYLYTADCSVAAHVLLEVAALARRFGVTELTDLCGSQPDVAAFREEKGEDRAETFEELLKSVWLDEDECGQPEEDVREDMSEQELEEIYEFAATQRKAAQNGAGEQSGGSESKQDAGERRAICGGTSRRKVPSTGMAVTECRGSEHLEQSLWQVRRDSGRPPLEPEQDAKGAGPFLEASREDPETLLGLAEEENLELHKNPGSLFSVMRGGSPEHPLQSCSAKEPIVSITSEAPSLSQGPQEDLRSAQKELCQDLHRSASRTEFSRHPSETLLSPSAPQPGVLPSSLNSSAKGGLVNFVRVNLEAGPIVVLDSDEEAEKAQAGTSFSFSRPGCSGEQSGASGCKLSQGAGCVSPSPRDASPGEACLGTLVYREAGPQGEGQQLLRLSSDEEDNWAGGLSWSEDGEMLVPDTPLLGRRDSSNTKLLKPTLTSGGLEEHWTRKVEESPVTPPTRLSLEALPPAGHRPLLSGTGKKPASSHMVVMDDSKELLEEAPLSPWRTSCVAEEGLSILQESVGSLLPFTENAKKHLGSPPRALRVRDDSLPGGSPVARKTAATLPLGAADSPKRKWWDCSDSAGEDSDGNDVLPLTQRLSTTAPVQKTPDLACQARETPCTTPLTPMPSYSVMGTPTLKKELSRFGVRALPKRQMVLKLKEIFQYTHQRKSTKSQGKPASSQRTPLHSPAQTASGTAELAVVYTTPEKHLPGFLQERQTDSCFRDPSDGVDEADGDLTGPYSPGRLKGTALSPTQFPIGGSKSGSAYIMSRGSVESSVSVASPSSSAASSLPAEDNVPASQSEAREAHKLEALQRHLLSTPALCRQILLYQPIELAGLQAELKQNGIKIAMGKLMDFLDAHCITFTTAETRREKQKHSHKSPQKRRRPF